MSIGERDKGVHRIFIHQNPLSNLVQLWLQNSVDTTEIVSSWILALPINVADVVLYTDCCCLLVFAECGSVHFTEPARGARGLI